MTDIPGANDDIRNALQIVVSARQLHCPCCDCDALLEGVERRLFAALAKLEGITVAA